MSNALRSLLHRDASVLPVIGRYGQCETCRSGYLRHEGESRCYQFVLWRCDHCGVCQRFPMPPNVESREQHGISAPLRDPVQDWNYVAQHLSASTGRLLQIDCGDGSFLVEARNAGWEVYGLEKSDFVARQIRKSHDLSIETGAIETCGFEDGVFDAVVVWNVLELSRDPRRFLKKVAEKLKPGGRLFLQTPNSRSWIKTWSGGFWAQWAPVHRFLFDIPSLQETCSAAGLKPVDIRTPGTPVWSRAFLQKVGWLPFFSINPFLSRFYDKVLQRWDLKRVEADRFNLKKWDLLGRWMASRGKGDQLLAVAEKTAEPAPECLICHSTLVPKGELQLVCLRCGVRQQKLSASAPQQKNGAQVRFFHSQQGAGIELLSAAEKRGLMGRLLDIGCGEGSFMQAARQRGWDVWGSEPGDYQGTVTSPLIALRMIAEPNWTERFMPDSCQLITLWDTLHQSEDPLGLLKAAARMLSPEGRIMARVINPRSVRRNNFPVFLRRFFSSESVCWLYEEKHLQTLFEQAGFSDIHIALGERCSGGKDEAYDLPSEWQRGWRFRLPFFLRRKNRSPWLFITARCLPAVLARRTRVLHLTESLMETDQTDVILSSVEALPYNQIQSDIAAGTLRSSARMTALRRRGISVRPLLLLSELSTPWAYRKIIRALIKLIREGNYDVVHTYGWRMGLAGRIAAAWVKARSRGRSAKYIVYQPMSHYFYGRYGGAISYGILWLERVLGLWTDLLVVSTDRGAFEFATRRVMAFDKTAVIPEGVDAHVQVRETDLVRRELQLPEDAWYMGYAGPLEEGVGVDTLLQAAQIVFATRPEARLLISGMGSAQLTFEALAKQMSILERVHFFENHMNLETFLSAVNVVVVPTPVDGIPKIVFQAAGARKPVVLTEVGGHSSLVLDGVTGMLVPSGDPGAMAKTLLKVGQGLKEAARLGDAAHAWIERMEDGAPQFSEERMCHLTRSLYDEILKKDVA